MKAIACALVVAASFWVEAGRAVRRLWEKPEPNVVTGNALAAENDLEGALKAYEAAKDDPQFSAELDGRWPSTGPR